MGSTTHKLCVAPMMDWTDRHCRYFHRQLSPSARLYTEMLTADAVIHGDRERLLGFDPAERPVALQLGGSEPEALAWAAAIGAEAGYDEINLNVGCPSARVREGRFGACLMKEAGLVRDCLIAMRDAVAVPVTLKTRIGVDELDSYEFLRGFIGAVSESGIDNVILHARKAWLTGLSPKDNREIPELDYARVYRIRDEFPALEIILNGGITTVEDARAHLEHVDGVMPARAAYRRPWLLAGLEEEFGAGNAPSSRYEVVSAMVEYAGRVIAGGGRLHQVARHMLGLYHGCTGARAWRRRLSRDMHRPDAGPGLLLAACPERDGHRQATPACASLA